MHARTSPARDRILKTAHDLFYRDGVRATGIDRVIAEAKVTKATFYRHYPSKNDLIRAFLDYRHERWMAWFTDALARHGATLDALPPTLREWFESDDFRGCAFINTLGELGGALPDVVDIVQRHKEDMTAAIADLGPKDRKRKQRAEAAALIVDGAIIRAQYDGNPKAALVATTKALNALAAS